MWGTLKTLCFLVIILKSIASYLFQGAFHYAKISGNFSSNINGTFRSRWKFSGKSGSPPEVVLFDEWVSPVRPKLAIPFSKAPVQLKILFLWNNVVPFSLG